MGDVPRILRLIVCEEGRGGETDMDLKILTNIKN